MKRILKLLLICLIVTSCNDKENKIIVINNCKVENPLYDLAWLNTIKENIEKSASASAANIYQYTYKNEPTFLVNDCVNCTDALAILYNCSWEAICEFGGIDGRITCPDFKDFAKDKKLLWSNTNQLIIDEELYNNTEANDSIVDVSINGDILTITVTDSGCDGSAWNVNLIDSSTVAESLPPQRSLKVQLSNPELCLAIVTREFEFNLSELQIDSSNELSLIIDNWDTPITYTY